MQSKRSNRPNVLTPAHSSSIYEQFWGGCVDFQARFFGTSRSLCNVGAIEVNGKMRKTDTHSQASAAPRL